MVQNIHNNSQFDPYRNIEQLFEGLVFDISVKYKFFKFGFAYEWISRDELCELIKLWGGSVIRNDIFMRRRDPNQRDTVIHLVDDKRGRNYKNKYWTC